VQDHPGKFEYVAGLVAPMGTLTWSGEVERLKQCDYVVPPSTGLGTASFIQQFRNRGFTAKFIGAVAQLSFRGLVDYPTCILRDGDLEGGNRPGRRG